MKPFLAKNFKRFFLLFAVFGSGCLYFLAESQAYSDNPSKLGVLEKSRKVTETKDDIGDLFYSVRIRPLGLIDQIYGGEAYVMTRSGYFFGTTYNIFKGTNTDKNTYLSNSELGFRLGKVFWGHLKNSGFFIFANFLYEFTLVSNYYQVTDQTFAVNIKQPGEALYVGYQIRTKVFGPDRWDVRLGLGIVNKDAVIKNFQADDQSRFQMGVRARRDPSLEFSLGYTF